VVPYVLGSYLVFKREPRNNWMCMGTLEGFWSMIAGEAHQQNSIRNPIIQVFHWMSKRILGRMRETKITDMEVSWLCSALAR
jgi:hypothetical protein